MIRPARLRPLVSGLAVATFALLVPVLSPHFLAAQTAARSGYQGKVNANVPRDRSIAIAEDQSSLQWIASPINLDYSARPGASCFYTTTGAKTGVSYCWGGQDTTAVFLREIANGLGAGNRNTSDASSYDDYCAGNDCSGLVANAWTSSRYSTSTMYNISANIEWESLKRGDATNLPGSHTRLFNRYTSDIGTVMQYESTSGSGVLWRNVHRSLARDTDYTPVRYAIGTYKTIDYPDPDLQYVRRTGPGTVEIRWDGAGDKGFRLYMSEAGGPARLVRDTDRLTSQTRTVTISGLLDGVSYAFTVSAVLRTIGETQPSDTMVFRSVHGAAPILLINGFDRYRAVYGTRPTLLTLYAAALDSLGLAYESAANETVIDGQTALSSYHAVLWMSGRNNDYYESFSWPEQREVQNYLASGGRFFVSGSDIAYDLISQNATNAYKSATTNDIPFANRCLGIRYVADGAGTTTVVGEPGSPLAGATIAFGTAAAPYAVTSADVLDTTASAQVLLRYSGGSATAPRNVAGLVRTGGPAGGTTVMLGFPFETIVEESARTAVIGAAVSALAVPVSAPLLLSAREVSPGVARIEWTGAAPGGFRLQAKAPGAAFTTLRDNTVLGPTAQSVELTDLTPGATYIFAIVPLDASGTAGAVSNSAILRLAAPGAPASRRLLVVDGYTRWDTQGAGAPSVFLESYAQALAALDHPFSSCINAQVQRGSVSLAGHQSVLWMLGQESTQTETFSAAEQALVQSYLAAGGGLLVSGAEVGWDLVNRGGAANEYGNGSPGDSAFYSGILKSAYVNDDAGQYSARGIAGGPFEGLVLTFDNGTQGTYDVKYPDTISPTNGGVAALRYGTSGSTTAAVAFKGPLSGSDKECRMLYIAFPIETIYPAASRSEAIARAVTFLTPATTSTGLLVH